MHGTPRRFGAPLWLAIAVSVALSSAAGAQVPASALQAQQAATSGAAANQSGGDNGVTPPFTIWDVQLGQPVTKIPDPDIVNVACGTDGGPPSLPLKNFSEYAKCPPEPSGLHEVRFEYDDEQAYVAKALELEYRFLQAGTSVYAHPVIVSVLVDDKGIARGIRFVTDDHASNYDRRSAASLETNLRARFGAWPLDCQKIPPANGEQPVGTVFVHDICTATDPQTKQSLRIESRYMRAKGEEAINPETQKVERGNYDSSTRFELVEAPYHPVIPTGPAAG